MTNKNDKFVAQEEALQNLRTVVQGKVEQNVGSLSTIFSIKPLNSLRVSNRALLIFLSTQYRVELPLSDHSSNLNTQNS